MDGTGRERELGELLKQLEACIPSEEEEKRRNIEWAKVKLTDWRTAAGTALPNWPFARWDNAEWVSKCDARVVRFLRSWQVLQDEQGAWVPGKSVLVCAPPKHGKSTGVLAAIKAAGKRVRQAVEAGQPFRRAPSFCWVTEAELVAEHRKYRDDLLQRAASAGICVLDELGVGGGHVAAVGGTPPIMHLLSLRHDRGLSTIVTSGIPSQELCVRYGGGAFRRMTERGRMLDIVGKARPS